MFLRFPPWLSRLISLRRCNQQNEPLCKDLLDLENEKSASVIIRDNEGNTPLHLAAMCIQSKDLRDRLCEKLAKFDLGVLQVPNGEGCLPSECSKFKSTKQLLRGLERRSIGKEKAKKDMLGRLSHGGVQDVNGELNDGASQETPEQTVARTQAEAEASGRLFPENETPSMRCIRVALAIKSLNTSDLHQPRGLGKAVSQSIQSAISSVFQGHQALEAPKGVGSSTTLMDADVISESLDDSSELEDPARLKSEEKAQ